MTSAINSNEQMIQKINEVLQTKKDAVVNIVNDKLTISVFSLLEKNLRNVKEINFVIRDVKFLPHQSEIAHEFEINPTDVLFNAYDITEKNKLQHFSKARSMHDFIEKHVNIRKVNAGIHIGGNILIIDDDFMIQGSSSLEVSQKRSRDSFSNINFDSILTGIGDREQILGALNTFKQIWFNDKVSADYKQELLNSLQYVYKEHSPEFLYYFTLNELFGNQLDTGVERFERDSVRFKKTQIWNALYDFQKDCVVSAIRKLNTYGGCIIADSVGLGKIFEALAVIKYFEISMNRVLVLTPAKLYDNWNSFRGDYKDSFLQEQFNYRIMFHTDLSRYSGMSRSGQDLKKFDWGLYDLVVIDESHNFRNRNDRYDENDQLVMTRYARLMQDVIKHGNNNTKVLMLSATPVNNSLVDLKNQINIITRDTDSAFEEEGITSVENLLRRTSASINTWEKQKGHKKEQLLDSLPSDFYKLLELMTISRSRKHITSYYGNKGVGKFPEKNKPITLNSDIDTKGELLNFKETNELLEALLLSVYTPTKYIREECKKKYIEKYSLKGKHGGDMSFDVQSRGMIVLHRFNLFKRLESSVFSFEETLRRLLERIERTEQLLLKGSGEVEQEDADFDDSGDDGVYIEGKYEIDVRDLRIDDYLEDLASDKYIIAQIHKNARRILDEERDKKLIDLKERIRKKVKETPYNSGNKFIDDCIFEINNKFKFMYAKNEYKVETGKAKFNDSQMFVMEEAQYGDQDLEIEISSGPKSDFEIANYIMYHTMLPRLAIFKILQGIDKRELLDNQDILDEITQLIFEKLNDAKAENITSYEVINGYELDSRNIFEMDNISEEDFEEEWRVFQAKSDRSSAMNEYYKMDSEGECEFAHRLENNSNVLLFTKLKKGGFVIDTPYGNYSPDWAVVCRKESLSDPSIGIYFVVESKWGKADANLQEVERNKIKCGKLHFKAVSDQVKFDWIKSYEDFKQKFGVAEGE